MKGYTVGRLLRSLEVDTGRYAKDLLETTISGISTDSRTLGKGDVFFALHGSQYDGAEYVENAFKNEALCAVVNADSIKSNFAGYPVIPVDDTIRTLGDAARDYRSMFKGTVIAVTGTSGKTTVKEMMLSVLGKKWCVHGNRGNFNNHIGLPLSLFGLDDTHECAVFELGMSAPGEIAYLAGLAKPQIGVILNVGPGHLEFFDSVMAIAYEKMKLIDLLGYDGTAVINGDDELLRARESRYKSRILRFGINGPWDYRAENVDMRPDGCASFEIEGRRITLKVPGLHNVYNALAAYTVGKLMGVDSCEAVDALESFTAPKMRMEQFEKNRIRYINDSYNANPLSMKVAVEVLKAVEISSKGRKIAVLGDMLELGAFSEQAHIDAGKLFSKAGLALLCLTGEHAEQYKQGAVDGGMNKDSILSFLNIDSAAQFINENKRPGDVILIKGSRAVGMEKFFSAIDGID